MYGYHFLFQGGFINSLYLSAGDVIASTEVNYVFLPSTSLLVHPFPVQSKPLQVLPQPLSSHPHLVARFPPHHSRPYSMSRVPAAQSLPGKPPIAQQRDQDREHIPQLVRGKASREIKSCSHNHPATLFPLPFFFARSVTAAQPAALNTRSLLLWLSPIPSPTTLYLADFLSPNLSAWRMLFHFLHSSIFPISKEGGVTCSGSPSPLIISLKHILLFQANVIWHFRACVFEDKKCQRTLWPFQHQALHKAGHGLPCCSHIQGTCSKRLAPEKADRGKN